MTPKNYCQICGELIARRPRTGRKTLESPAQYMNRKTCGRGTTCYTTFIAMAQTKQPTANTPPLEIRYDNALQVGSLKFPMYFDMQNPNAKRWAWYGGIPLTEAQIIASAKNLIKSQRNLA